MYGHDWLQTFRYKSRELGGLSAEVREKSVVGLAVIYIFCKNAILNIYVPISQKFSNQQENDNIS